MKKTIKFLMLFAVVSALSFSATSCQDDEIIIPEGDKTALNALITECDALLLDALEGTTEGTYQEGSIAVFQASVDEAKVVSTLTLGAYQTVIDEAFVNLTTAKTVFEAAYIPAVEAP